MENNHSLLVATKIKGFANKRVNEYESLILLVTERNLLFGAKFTIAVNVRKRIMLI